MTPERPRAASGRLRQRLGRLRTLPILPTLFTAGNLAFGVTAILCANSGLLGWGGLCVFAAMVCDMLDGKIARLTGTEGDFGAELDSLADVVSFGVAPAMLMHRLVLGEPGVLGDGERVVWLVAVLYAVFTAIRLARYNVEHSDAPTAHFKGLPSPGAAAVLCGWICLYAYLAHAQASNHHVYATGSVAWLAGQLPSVQEWRPIFAVFIMGIGLLMAVLMVSTLPFPHLGNTLVRGRIRFRQFILIVLLLGVAVVWHVVALVALTSGYVLACLIPGLLRAARQWGRGRMILDDEDEAGDDADDAPDTRP